MVVAWAHELFGHMRPGPVPENFAWDKSRAVVAPEEMARLASRLSPEGGSEATRDMVVLAQEWHGKRKRSLASRLFGDAAPSQAEYEERFVGRARVVAERHAKPF